jgi:hypothetical protein
MFEKRYKKFKGSQAITHTKTYKVLYIKTQKSKHINIKEKNTKIFESILVFLFFKQN